MAGSLISGRWYKVSPCFSAFDLHDPQWSGRSKKEILVQIDAVGRLVWVGKSSNSGNSGWCQIFPNFSIPIHRRFLELVAGQPDPPPTRKYRLIKVDLTIEVPTWEFTEEEARKAAVLRASERGEVMGTAYTE